MATLYLQNVSKYFGKIKALSDINLAIKEGTFCVVLGPSGCGKSTLLNLIAGLEEVTTGRIYLGDKDITQLPPHKRNIAMVFQNYALYPHLSVFENIAFGLRIKGEKKEDIRTKVQQVSRSLDIEDKLDNFPRELSGGQMQRVATGRAIIRDPNFFLFDEPLSNLDARLRIELRAEFIKLHKRLKKTIIYVTHDQIEAMSLGQEIIVLKDGCIQQVSSPENLYYNPQNLFVAEFIGTPPMNIIKFMVKDNKDIMLAKGDFFFEAPDNFKNILNNYIGQEVFFGFRPSSAQLSTEGNIKGEVIFTEIIGEDSYARLRINPEVEINIKISGASMLRPQTPVLITIDKAKAYFFDSSGKRIYA